MNEIDLRVAKVLRFGRTRTSVGFDVFNLINTNAILTYNQTYYADRPVAGAAGGDVAAVLQDQRADRLLT